MSSNTQKLHEAFRQLVAIEDKVANTGITINVQTLRNELEGVASQFAEAINSIDMDGPAPQTIGVRADVWMRAWSASEKREETYRADGCLSDFDLRFPEYLPKR